MKRKIPLIPLFCYVKIWKHDCTFEVNLMNNQDATYQLTLIIQCYFYVWLFSPQGSYQPPLDTIERD